MYSMYSTYIRRGVPLNLGPRACTSNPDASSIPGQVTAAKDPAPLEQKWEQFHALAKTKTN
jgi:hypothetical protein